jgi:hypothetical protein
MCPPTSLSVINLNLLHSLLISLTPDPTNNPKFPYIQVLDLLLNIVINKINNTIIAALQTDATYKLKKIISPITEPGQETS